MKICERNKSPHANFTITSRGIGTNLPFGIQIVSNFPLHKIHMNQLAYSMSISILSLYLIITPMRRLALPLLIILSWTLSAYASTPDARIHITLPTGLSSTVATTLQSEIESKISKEMIAPESISAKSTPVTVGGVIMAMDSIDPTNWEQTIDVTRVYSDTHITSLLITTYEYTG
jgi:hypothetical protein